MTMTSPNRPRILRGATASLLSRFRHLKDGGSTSPHLDHVIRTARQVRRAHGTGDWEGIRTCIPTDHAQQVTSAYYASRALDMTTGPLHVLDLGCGVGKSRKLFSRPDRELNWIGIDIPDSMESQARPSMSAKVILFDGLTIPIAAKTFDVVYSHQVFEHVRYPDVLLTEVARVLKAGGLFVGSTSQMEPYHSRSYWGYTPPGFASLLGDAGLRLVEIRPGIDAVTLIKRAHAGPKARADYGKWFEQESPLNAEIDEWGRVTGRGAGAVNDRKLRFCGQFAFMASTTTKPHQPVA